MKQTNLIVLLLFHSLLIANNSRLYLHRCCFEEIADKLFTQDIRNPWLGFYNQSQLLHNPTTLKPGAIIYSNQHELRSFFKDMHPRITVPYILITHIYDEEVPGEFIQYLDDPHIIAWFGINARINHPKMHQIPIGLYQSIAVHKNHGANITLLKQMRTKQAKEKLLYINLSPSHPDRDLALNHYANNKYYTFAKRIPFYYYLHEMSKHKFTLSPPGAGEDCYRTWEALLVGSIPIVRSSFLNPLYQDLPVLIIEDWKQITPEFLYQKYREMRNQKYNWEKLTPRYWIDLIYKTRDEFLKNYLRD